MCRCCGIADYRFLTLDHVIPRSKLRDKDFHQHSATETIMKLARDGFPDGMQILCFNCNLAKSNKPHCPHQDDEGYTQPS